jgi:hypothetical protein
VSNRERFASKTPVLWVLKDNSRKPLCMLAPMRSAGLPTFIVPVLKSRQ